MTPELLRRLADTINTDKEGRKALAELLDVVDKVSGIVGSLEALQAQVREVDEAYAVTMQEFEQRYAELQESCPHLAVGSDQRCQVCGVKRP